MRSRSSVRRHGVVVALGLALALLVSGCSAEGRVEPDVPAQIEGALPADTQQQLQSAVEFAMAATGSPGALVGVWAPWSGQWVAGVGTSDPATGAPADPGMTFRATTLSRAMTCDVLYALASRGTVALTDPVSTYVASAVNLGDVTLGQLCDGTSGIGSYRASVQGMWAANPGRVWEPRELVSFGLGHRTGVPGQAWVDSDAGYQLLGLALESASGSTMADLYERYVTDRLGMASTFLPDPPAAEPGGDPLRGFVSLPGPDGALACATPVDVTRASSSIGFTDSGVVSSLDDAREYTQALATGALMPDGMDRFAKQWPVAPDAPTWFTAGGGAYHAGSLVGEFGSVPGYLTASFADAATGLTVVVVLNNSAASERLAAYLAWELAAIASKAAPAAGREAVDAGLPWTPQQYHDAIAQSAVCPLPGA